MTTIKRFLETTKSLLTNPRALAILATLYALLLATLGAFIKIREATLLQVVVTLFFLVLIPVEFFVLQAAILQHARTERFQWAQILRDAIKIAVVSIPMVLLGFALYYLLNKWQAHYPAPEPSLALPAKAPPAPQPLHWPTVLFATVRLLILGVALPLATIQLWIEVAARDVRTSLDGGAKTVLQRIGNTLAGAFAFDSVLAYGLGLIVFVLVPYAILFVPISVKGNKTDFVVFVARLVLVYLFTLIGWIVTLTTLARSTSAAPSPVPASTVPNAPAEAPA
ncbi:MAG TPA: hypothetical protein VII34_04585 [Pyrinomonadaceae bacterium]